MARFLSRAFSGLGKIFRFEGAKDPLPMVELELGTQLVFDTSRSAERHATGGGYSGGYFLWEMVDATGAGNVFESASFAQILAQFYAQGQPADFVIWVLGVRLNTTTVASADIAAGIWIDTATEFPHNALTQDFGWLVYVFNADAGEMPPTGPTTARPAMVWDDADTATPLAGGLPFPLAPGTGIGIQIDYSGSTTVQAVWLLWIGPRGSTPPGLA